MQSPDILVAGGGIGGLAAALAAARAGARVRLLEQAHAWGEVGAGVQMGPNAVRVLADWGLLPALQACAAFPQALRVRDSREGRALGLLHLAGRATARYGHAYATVHRADLHGLLLRAVSAEDRVHCELGTRVTGWRDADAGVWVDADAGEPRRADLLLGCDGVWSRVRAGLLGDGPPPPTGHLAYRGLVAQAELPASRRQRDVTAWLGPRHHVVHYPVRGGEWLNVVAVVQGRVDGDSESWDHQASAAGLREALGPVQGDLQAVLEAVPGWRLWPLHDRAPLRGAQEQARGRVLLMGDAAHPMRPYLAQGAAMALEDAWTLGRLLSRGVATADLPGRVAALRWRRNAWVQARSRRNGWVFHLDGPLRWGRDAAMGLLGERLLDVPRLYAGPPEA